MHPHEQKLTLRHSPPPLLTPSLERKGDPVLHILDENCGTIPCRSGFLSRSLRSECHYDASGLHGGGCLPRLGHLCLQLGHIHATPGQVLQKQGQEKKERTRRELEALR
jgi:hypothetical protein